MSLSRPSRLVYRYTEYAERYEHDSCYDAEKRKISHQCVFALSGVEYHTEHENDDSADGTHQIDYGVRL